MLNNVVQPAAFLRTTLPLGIDMLEQYDSGRYHSIWLPDHMVSFWPDSIWTPEFTDLATTSPSPHRHLDGMAVAAAAAVLTQNVPIATSVVDTVRRHPAMLAQTALTLDHLSKGRFILGLGSGETENTVPYGFDFAKPVSRFEEALKVIKLLWDSDGPGRFRRPVLPPRARADGHRALRRQAPADLDRRRRARACSTSPGATPTAGGRRAPTRRRTTPPSSAASATPPSARAATRWRSSRRITQICLIGDDDEVAEMLEAAAGQVDHPDAHREGPASSSATSTRWARTGAAIRTSTPSS